MTDRHSRTPCAIHTDTPSLPGALPSALRLTPHIATMALPSQILGGCARAAAFRLIVKTASNLKADTCYLTAFASSSSTLSFDQKGSMNGQKYAGPVWWW